VNAAAPLPDRAPCPTKKAVAATRIGHRRSPYRDFPFRCSSRAVTQPLLMLLLAAQAEPHTRPPEPRPGAAGGSAHIFQKNSMKRH
jgi:hypothetical protein